MNTRSPLVLAFVLSLAGLMLAGEARPSTVERSTLRLCFEDLDVPPWRYRNHTGHNFRLLDTVAADAGVRFRYVGMPWKRCISSVAQGQVDGGFALSHIPERVGMGVFPPGHVPGAPTGSAHRLFIDGYVLVRRRGDRVRFEGGRLVDLRGAVAAQSGYSVVDDLKRMGAPVDDGSRDPMAAIRKLVEGRVGAAAIGGNKMRALQATGDPLLARLEVLPLLEKDYFLVLSNDLVAARPELADAIWRGIAARRDATPLEARSPVAAPATTRD